MVSERLGTCDLESVPHRYNRDGYGRAVGLCVNWQPIPTDRATEPEGAKKIIDQQGNALFCWRCTACGWVGVDLSSRLAATCEADHHVCPDTPRPPLEGEGLNGTVPTASVRMARRFHEIYEDLAPRYGWETQERSRVPWFDLPTAQQALMAVTVHKATEPLRAERDTWQVRAEEAEEVAADLQAEKDEQWSTMLDAAQDDATDALLKNKATIDALSAELAATREVLSAGRPMSVRWCAEWPKGVLNPYEDPRYPRCGACGPCRFDAALAALDASQKEEG